MVFALVASALATEDTCKPFELKHSTNFVASYQGRLTGWASGGSWDPLACPQHAEAGYQWLAFAGNITQSSSIFEAAPEYGGAIRVLRAGTVAGSVSVHWDGHTTEWSKYLIVGESTLQPGELPSPHDSCLLPASACGACLDGFNFADCSCDEGATEVTFSHVVEAGKLLQVAAIPNQFVGADEGTLRGSLFVSFAPGGYCDFTQGEGGGSDGCVSPWDGVWLGENGCIVEGATQALDDEEHALELATQGCYLTAIANDSPFFYRDIDDGSDFIATVQARDSSTVQFNGGGLLVSAPWDGATEWVALRVVTSRSSGHVELQSVTEGRMPVEELASTANVPEVWLQLERKAGVLHARWRAVETQAWVEMAGSPIEHAALQGAVRIGLTHQTFMPNVGSITLANFALEGAGVAMAVDEGVTLANEMAWTFDWCMGPALMLDETDDHALLPRSVLCSLDALTQPGPSAVALRLWWRMSELEGQMYLPNVFGEFEEWLYAYGLPGAPGSLNVYLQEGSGELRTRVCGWGATEPTEEEGAACASDALDVEPLAKGPGFADDAWHFYLLSIACNTPELPGSCEGRVFLDGELRAASPVGAPRGLASAPPDEQPTVGARADLDPLRYYGGLMSRVALSEEAAAPTEQQVLAEWHSFWDTSPCHAPSPPAAVDWVACGGLLLVAVCLLACCVPGCRRRVLHGQAPLPSAEPTPADQGRWLLPTKSNTFNVKSTPRSFEICCTGTAMSSSPGSLPAAGDRRIISPRAAPPGPATAAQTSSPGSFRSVAGARGVTIQASSTLH